MCQEKSKPVVSQLKVSYISSDGQNMELKYVLPYEVVSKLVCEIINWEEEWLFTAKEYKAYQVAEEEFCESLKEKNKS